MGPPPCGHVRGREQADQRATPARLRVPGHAPEGSASRRDSLVRRQARRSKRDKHVRGLMREGVVFYGVYLEAMFFVVSSLDGLDTGGLG